MFFKIFTPFSHTILRNAPGTILDHSHNCPRVIFGENTTLMHGILGPHRHRQPPGVKKVFFPKKFPSLKSPEILYFLYPQTSLILFYFIRFFVAAGLKHPGPGFVFGENSANFSKKAVTLLEKTPSCKSPKNSYFLYPWGALTLFYFERILMAASVGPGSSVWGLGGLARGKP